MSEIFKREGKIVVVSMKNDLTASTGSLFRETILNYDGANPGIQEWILDMEGVDFLDSSGLGVLVALLKRIAEKGGDIKLANLRKKVRTVFEITRAFRIFHAYESVEEAVKAIP
jgi:anti-sigma B factor antagonist